MQRLRCLPRRAPAGSSSRCLRARRLRSTEAEATDGSRLSWTASFAAGAAAAAAAAGIAATDAQLTDMEDHKRAASDFAADMNRLRCADDVFDRVASVEKDGVKYMTAEDFFRSFTVRHYGLQGMRSGGDPPQLPFLGDSRTGLISRAEYLFWVEVLGVNEAHVDVTFRVFDADGNGLVSASEFGAMMSGIAAAQAGTRIASKEDGSRREVVPDLSTLAAGHRLFGSDLSSSLSAAQFKELVESLRRAIVYYEFCCYQALEGTRPGEGGPGTADAHALGHALVAHAKPSSLPTLVARAGRARRLGRVTFEEYLAAIRLFTSFPQDMRDALAMAQRVHGGVRPDVFKRLATGVSGSEVSDRVVSILFCVFDADGDGTLDVSELDVVINNRALDTRGQDRPGKLAAFWNCTKDTYHSRSE